MSNFNITDLAEELGSLVDVDYGKGRVKTYRKTAKGTHYDPATPKNIIEFIDLVLGKYSTRWLVIYGDASKGEIDTWAERCYFSTSSGPVKIPLAIARSSSSGGIALLDASIIAILSTCKPYAYKVLHPQLSKAALANIQKKLETKELYIGG